MMRALTLALVFFTGGLRAALPLSDAFGYTAISAPYGWTDISGTGTPISKTAWIPNADDGAIQVDLPFNFRFYGSTYTKVYLSTNGYVQFGTSSFNYAPNCLNLNVAPLNIAAAYWMDLDPSAGGTVHKEVLNLAPNRTMVLQFTGVPPRVGTGTVTFQIIIGEDNSIEFIYVSTSTHDGGASATSGLRAAFDCPNHQGLPISCAQAVLSDGTRIRISYPGIEPGCGTPTITLTSTVSSSFTLSPTRTDTPTITPSFSVTATSTNSPTITPTGTVSPSFSASPSVTASFTVTPSYSATGTVSPSFSPSPTPSSTSTATASFSVSPTYSISSSFSASPTNTNTATVTPSATISPSSTDTASATASATRTLSPSSTQSSTSSLTPTFSVSPTASPTFSSTPTLPPAASKPACLVLGQLDFNSATLVSASAATFNSPGGVAMDTRITPFRIYVADTAHHRVLYWNNASTITLGGPADGVIGQSNFSASVANHGAAVAADGLFNPKGLAVDPVTGALWVADAGNHRVLRFSLPLSATGSTADRVLGQANNFLSNAANQGGLSASSLNDPENLSTDNFGNLAVADSGNHRVLRFINPGSTSVAATSWGQGGSFTTNSANLGGVSAQSLSYPTATLLLANELWIADTGNHRVLQYSLGLPLAQAAVILLGQANFGLNSANRGYGLTNDDRFDSPRGLGMDLAGRVLVADTNNHRVIGFEPPYGGLAVLVWGQTNLGLKNPSVGNDRMFSPLGLAANGATFIVADSGNHRVLGYGCGSGLQPSTSTPTFTPTPSQTPTSSITMTVSVSPTQTPSFSASPSYSASPTRTLSFTNTQTPLASMTATCTPSFSASPSFTITPTFTITLTPTYSQTAPAVPTAYPRSANGVISYPNPTTRAWGRACFAFPSSTNVEIDIYDQLGQLVANLDSSSILASQGNACWDLKSIDGSLVVPGIYYVKVITDGQSRLTKLTLSK